MTETARRSRWDLYLPGVDDVTAEALIARHIEQLARGGRHLARLKNAGVSVWALIGYLRGATISETARAYDVSDEAMLAAVAYYQRHQALIDAQLLLMDEGWT